MTYSIRTRVVARLGRITSGRAFVPEIDGLRFIALAAVLVYHLNGNLLSKIPHNAHPDAFSRGMMELFEHGDFGVQLFFAISGFILALPFAAHHLEGAEKPLLDKYFLRRLTRLEPPYLINLLLVFVLLVQVNHASATVLLPHLAASMGYLHNLMYHEGSAINFVAWSLEVEVQFYLLAPILTGVFALPNRFLRRGLIIFVMALFIALQQAGFFKQLTILRFIQYFLVGFLLVDIYLVDWKRAPSRRTIFDLLSVVCWSGLALTLVYNWARPWLLPGLMTAAYIGAFRGPLSNRIFRDPWLVTIGGMCYTFYLYHSCIISFVGRASLSLAQGSPYWLYFTVQATLHFAVIVVAGSVLFALFEQPFMRRDWPARLWARLTGGAHAATKTAPL